MAKKKKTGASQNAGLAGEPKRVSELLDVGERVLSDSTHIFDDHDNHREAEDLLAYCLDVEIGDLNSTSTPPRRVRERYLSLITRRAGGEPFPLLTGTIEFYGLRLEVRPGSFVPRPSSELMVARAVKRLRRRQGPVAIDVCTGAGPIALAIADELPTAEVWGADIDTDGLNQGRRNARRLEIPNVTFRKGDMYAALPSRLRAKADAITGHIPYVPFDEIDDLPTEVRDYEPLFTLSDQSPDGLDLIRRATLEAPEWLKPGGWLFLEISDDMAKRVQKICKKAGFETTNVASDADDLSVVVEARLPR
jgi:release factor glutamine methyltransferase